MTRARDLADSADKDITGTLTVDGLDVSGSSTFGTPSGDTRFNFDGANQYRAVFKNGGTVGGQIGAGGADDLRFSNAAGATVATIKDGNVGIGTTPDRDLHVKGASGDPVHFKLEGDPADYARIMFDDGTTDNIGELRYNFGSDYMSFNTNAAERMRIDASGRVTTPNQPSFTAHKNGNQAVTPYTSNTLTGWTCPSHGNVGSHFNTSNGRFTAPVAGFYLFTGAVQCSAQQSLHIAFWMNGTHYESDSWLDHGNSTLGAELTRIIYLTANQYINLIVLPTATCNVNQNRTRFQAYLLG